MCHSCSVIQGFVTARDWLAHKYSKGDVAGTSPTERGHRGLSCPVWNATLDTRVWQNYRVSRTVWFAEKGISVKNPHRHPPNFKVGAMDGTELNY